MKSLTKILEGIGSIICLFPKENERKITLPNISIHESLESDWEKIGLDMWKAYRVIEEDNNGKLKRTPN